MNLQCSGVFSALLSLQITCRVRVLQQLLLHGCSNRIEIMAQKFFSLYAIRTDFKLQLVFVIPSP
jgi:hypothetical protein